MRYVDPEDMIHSCTQRVHREYQSNNFEEQSVPEKPNGGMKRLRVWCSRMLHSLCLNISRALCVEKSSPHFLR